MRSGFRKKARPASDDLVSGAVSGYDVDRRTTVPRRAFASAEDLDPVATR